MSGDLKTRTKGLKPCESASIMLRVCDKNWNVDAGSDTFMYRLLLQILPTRIVDSIMCCVGKSTMRKMGYQT